MKNSMLRSAAFLAGLMISGAAIATPTYTLTLIDPLPGYANSVARGISDNGLVVGESSYSDPVLGGVHRAFMWNAGSLTDLGALSEIDGYSFSAAYGVNSNGQVVGLSDSETGPAAFLWEAGTMTDIGDGGVYSSASGINESGQVAGFRPNSGFVWQSGVFTDIGDLPGGEIYSNATAINDAGHVAGNSQTGFGNEGHRAFLSVDGVMTDLGDLPGGFDASFATAINNANQVVGNSEAETGTRAFMWQSGIMIDLGDLPGGTDHSQAFGINDSGQVVGIGNLGASTTAFLWDEDFGMMDLNSLVANLDGIHLDYAFAINSSGQIVGLSSRGRAFLLTPVTVPEPVTLGLLSAGLFGVGALRRSSRKAACI